ncbi:2,4-dienoyl-CoA reductase-like NADH-dependent reductase (Old Yellow Enzyme family) [Peribacillus cavernae]|nr:2,4-dienoyl-CoA reductase-like NADH-dependent reductase (Old Yellow Enzyme family) [Peribacillus cavernae]
MQDIVSIKDCYIVRISNKFFMVIEIILEVENAIKEEVVFIRLNSDEARRFMDIGV